jgi:hypothetical protein
MALPVLRLLKKLVVVARTHGLSLQGADEAAIARDTGGPPAGTFPVIALQKSPTDLQKI